MSPPADDDFGDLDALGIDLEENAMLTGADGRHQSKGGAKASLFYPKSNKANHSTASRTGVFPSHMTSHGVSNPARTSTTRDEFDEFGDLGDTELLLDDDDFLEGSASPAPVSSALPRVVPLHRNTTHPQPQQVSAPSAAQQPTKYFSIFGGATNQPTKNPTLQRAPSTSLIRNNSNVLSRSSSYTPSIGQKRQGSNVTISPFLTNHGASTSTGGLNPPPQPPPLFTAHQTPRPNYPFAQSVLPRSDPLNDFAEDIFWSPESSAAHPAESPTHHLIDQQATLTWQYPINYPKRDYQFNIIRRALFTNTLVSLPTGLGKTFIAAVVMLNYFRWFPKSKIIFMAPTRPLVNQQIEACFNICGIPQDETIELTGQQNAELRKKMWAERRVIFCTPQVLQNDLKSGICEARDIVCLVIDEAHRATGRYAYSEVIRLLDPLNRDVRVMALTATPGGDMKTVQQVVQNLKIAKIEMRTEDSMDLQKYVFKRTIQEMVVPCGREVGDIRDKFHRMMRPFLDRLVKQNILRTADPGQLSRFALLQGRDACLRERSLDGGTKAFIMKQVTICIGLVHAYELLTVHGIRPFFANMDPFAGSSNNTINARASSSGSKQKNFDEDLDRDDDNRPTPARKAMEEIPDFMRMMDGIRAKMKQPNFMSHPKLERLVGVVVEHFVSHQDESDALVQARADSAASSSTATTIHDPLPQTRVMIFANYRESVEEISRVLDQHRPLVKVQSFIGQATAKGKKGISQKEQQKVVADFQKGEHNVLVATSIGEEGLDIGDVDLIICYDSHSSPIRMLQRMGRTGRKRKGKICLLLAEGQEEQKYRRSQTSYKNVQRSIAHGNNIMYYPNSPRILPPGPPPKCEEVHLHVPNYVTPSTSRKRRKLADSSIAGPRPSSRNAFLDFQELARFQQRYLIPKREIRKINFKHAAAKLLDTKKRSTMTPDTTFQVGHSTRTTDFIRMVNGFSKSRVEQSLASVMGHSERGEKDPYSKRMLGLIKQWGVSGTGSDELGSGVSAKPKGKDSSRTENSSILDFPDRGRGSSSLEALSEDDIETLHVHNLGATRRLPSHRLIDLSDDEEEKSGHVVSRNKRAEPSSKRKNVESKTYGSVMSSIRDAGQSGVSARVSAKSTASYFHTISDDEVDMEIMDGFADAFGEHSHDGYVPDGSPDLVVHGASGSVTGPSKFNAMSYAQDNNWTESRKGFDFREPLTPPSLWYISDERYGKDKDDISMEASPLTRDSGSFVVFELPPAPPPGQWYRPSPVIQPHQKSMERSATGLRGSEKNTESYMKDQEEEEEMILFIESSEGESEAEREDVYPPGPPSSLAATKFHSSSATPSLPNPGFVSAGSLVYKGSTSMGKAKGSDKGKGKGKAIADEYGSAKGHRHGQSKDQEDSKQRQDRGPDYSSNIRLWGDDTDIRNSSNKSRGGSTEIEDFEFDELALGDDDLQEDEYAWE